MTSCFRVKGLLSAYLDRELSGEEMMLLREHLSGCDDCSLEFGELRRVKAALLQMPVVEADPALLGRIKAEVFASSAPIAVSKNKVMASAGMAAAMMFLVLVLLRWVDVQRQTETVRGSGLDSSLNAPIATEYGTRSSSIPVTLVSVPE